LDKDRNFDDLSGRFQRNVYGGLKGKIRLEVLRRDVEEWFPEALTAPQDQPLAILDAGGGCGPFSLPMAKNGHSLVLCDVSEKMLAIAQQQIAQQNIEHYVRLVHGPIQLLDLPDESMDLILCHAVLEWVEFPEIILAKLAKMLKPSGILSLTFYNKNGMIFKNLLRTNYKKIIKEDYIGSRGSLTPTWPRLIEEVRALLEPLPLALKAHSGMRVFHDYILDTNSRDNDPQLAIQLELSLSRQSPFRELARYQHFILQKTKDLEVR